MTHNELITELLKYDGWVFTTSGKNIKIEKFVNGKFLKGTWVWFDKALSQTDMLYTYLTDMNILHRIAVKVVANISGILDNSEDLDFNLAELNNKIVSAMFTSSNEQGEHIQLATALVNAIRYIIANKAG